MYEGRQPYSFRAPFRNENGGSDDAVLSFERTIPLPVELDEDEAQCDWASDHWGTPRNIQGGLFSDDLGGTKYFFVTRAPPPLVWLIAVAEKYPALDLSLHYQKRGMQWTGTMRCERGRLVSHMEYEGVELVAQSSKGEG